MTADFPARERSGIELRDRVTCLQGYGMRSKADGYLYLPESIDDLREALNAARVAGRQVCFRGAGRSYGDANIGAECVLIDFSRMNRILGWDADLGILDCEAGVTIEDIWRRVLSDGYWPPVVSGTMYPQLGGALAMNIHGKNNFCAGTIGEHLVELRVFTPDGNLLIVTPNEDAFYEFVSTAGLLGAIVECKIKLKKVATGDLKVFANAPKNWDDQIKTFERFEKDSDYMVSWIDCFAKGSQSGRGQFHAAWHEKTSPDAAESLTPNHQDLPEKMFAVLPKSVIWRFLKPLNNRIGMRLINGAKSFAARALGNEKYHRDSLVGFSFLLDYVPNWRNAYLPGGFIQYQSFVPKERAAGVFARQIELQQAAKLESFLGVMKQHRPDRFLFSHAVDGYSLALDFKVTTQTWERLQNLCHQFNDLVLDAGGKFYFAKDSTLRPVDVQRWLGPQLDRYFELKRNLDPENLLTSELARRVNLSSETGHHD